MAQPLKTLRQPFNWLRVKKHSMMSAYVILSFRSQERLTPVPVSWEVLYSDQLASTSTKSYTLTPPPSSCLCLSPWSSSTTSRRVSLAQQGEPASSSCKKLAKSHRNMLVSVSVFCFCFVPYHLVRLPNAFLWRHCSWSKVFYYLMQLTIVLSVLNVCLDPLIYFIFCKAFRTQLSRRVGSRNR